MLKKKKGFTLVELVIVIAVIAILSSVLLPVFSNIIAQAKEAAATQSARTILSEAMNMSSDFQLPGKDKDGNYRTTILLDGYAFGYGDNKLETANYPGVDGTNVLVFSKNYNTVILSSANISENEIVHVNEIISKTTDLGGNFKTVKTGDKYYITDGTNVCSVFTNDNFSLNAIVFTITKNITDETKEDVIEKADFNSYETKETGKGSNVNFDDLN